MIFLIAKIIVIQGILTIAHTNMPFEIKSIGRGHATIITSGIVGHCRVTPVHYKDAQDSHIVQDAKKPNNIIFTKRHCRGGKCYYNLSNFSDIYLQCQIKKEVKK